MIDPQKFSDSINSMLRSEREDYHLTLGELRRRVSEHRELFGQDAPVEFRMLGTKEQLFVGSVGSYRGYYEDLAFEPTTESQVEVVKTADDLLRLCNWALDRDFPGYKGGSYTMSADTPLWVSPHGHNTKWAILDTMNREADTLVVVVKDLSNLSE